MERLAKWICPAQDMGEVSPVFEKQFSAEKAVANATLEITALGVYEAHLNGTRVGSYVLAPGWTHYQKRLQYQSYDVTGLVQGENHLEVGVGKGWYRGRLGWPDANVPPELTLQPAGLFAQLHIVFTDGSRAVIATDSSWQVKESCVRFSELYDGETFDANCSNAALQPVTEFQNRFDNLVPQQGEEIREQERLSPLCWFKTPKGELVIDFGQEITGYVELQLTANKGEVLELSHAEVMDKEGNFYTENYRSAKAKLLYTCRDGKQSYHPKFTFFGFRYIRVDQLPSGCGPDALGEQEFLSQFTAVVVHSQMERTGEIRTSNPLLNKLFENILWGQKGNFLDVPTDCPQRDERLGWTGDAQAFVKTASYNFDVETFFIKWLADLAENQGEDGLVGFVIPDVLNTEIASAAWGDAATICPWQIYQTYGNPEILVRQYDSMKNWVSYITTHTTTQYLWTGGTHFGDWLGLDAPSGSYKGSSREDFIASAFYAWSTALVIKAGKILDKDVSEFETLYSNILTAFRKTYPSYHTQTEYTLAVQFALAEDLQAAADALAELVKADGNRLMTGFVGTPYLLHVLSRYGHSDLAYTLLLREAYPSWLYPVTKGATTIWEHWDGIMENGDFWSRDMNSYNHYAYGAVADWIYEEAAGISPLEPGFAQIRFAPKADGRLEFLEASIKTRQGLAKSKWSHVNGKVKYEILTPAPAEITISGITHRVSPGSYIFYS